MPRLLARGAPVGGVPARSWLLTALARVALRVPSPLSASQRPASILPHELVPVVSSDHAASMRAPDRWYRATRGRSRTSTHRTRRPPTPRRPPRMPPTDAMHAYGPAVRRGALARGVRTAANRNSCPSPTIPQMVTALHRPRLAPSPPQWPPPRRLLAQTRQAGRRARQY